MVNDEVKGTIKLMFQPGEELLEGAKAMIKAGVLENPVVDCAMAIHCYPGDSCSIRYSHVRAWGGLRAPCTEAGRDSPTRRARSF